MSVRLPGAQLWSSEPLLQDRSILFRSGPSSSFLTPLQSQVEGLVGGFTAQATDWRSLAAILSGGMAYRVGKIGLMGMGSGNLIRAASVGAGLTAEVSAFELTHRTLHPENSNLWRWEGSGGLRQGLLQSFITFGALKSAGHLARGENFVVRHLLQDSAMVWGHQASAALGVAPPPSGTLAEQFLHAEATNLQIGAGTALLHRAAPGIQALERGLDLSLRGSDPGALREGPLPIETQPAFATAYSSRTGGPSYRRNVENPSMKDFLNQMSSDPEEKDRACSAGRTGSGQVSLPPSGPMETRPVTEIPRAPRAPSPIPEPALAEALVENEPIMLLVTDAKGTVVYANAQARNVMGPDLLGKKMMDFLDMESSDSGSEHLQCRLRTDTERKVLWEDRPHPSNSNLTAHYLLDVTGKAENARLQDEVLRLQVKVGEGFLAREVIHDARNPLTTATLTAQLLKAFLERNFPDRASQPEADPEDISAFKNNPFALLRNLDESLQRSAEILVSGLNILRGGVVDLSLEGVLTDIISQNVPLWIHNNIHWKMEIDPHIGIFGSRQGISRALQNVLENARQAMPNGGSITIRAHAEGRNAVIEIIDTGQGIPRENLDRIFETGFTTKGEEGYGLGLPMVKKVIEELHRGKIEVESEIGTGTTFRITLPQIKSDPPQTLPTP